MRGSSGTFSKETYWRSYLAKKTAVIRKCTLKIYLLYHLLGYIICQFVWIQKLLTTGRNWFKFYLKIIWKQMVKMSTWYLTRMVLITVQSLNARLNSLVLLFPIMHLIRNPMYKIFGQRRAELTQYCRDLSCIYQLHEQSWLLEVLSVTGESHGSIIHVP